MTIKTPDELAHETYSKICQINKDEDCEIAHITADDILRDLIKDLGYPLVAEAYDKVCKWYA